MLGISQYEKYKQGENPAQMITSQCLYPKKIRITDSCGIEQDMYVPCGCCVRCSDNLREQWVSRMCLHSLEHKHCYFITLTYGVYDLYKYTKHPFKDSWCETVPKYTKKNYTGKPGYAPTLLRQEHLTKFMKRLRKRLGFNVSFVAAGEYGTKYLRPHFHIILWSDQPVTKEDVTLSWSYDCVQLSKDCVVRFAGQKVDAPRFRFLVGRVDFHDLVANGTLNFDAVASNETSKLFDSRHVFSYVAKYVAKRSQMNERLREHILSAFYHFPFVETFTEQADFNEALQSWHRELMFAKYYSREPRKQNTLLAPFYDEQDGSVLVNVKHNSKIITHVNKKKFVEIFQPFFVCSRSASIGRSYYEKNFERFQTKDFSLPKFHGKTLVFPSFFLRLLKNERCSVYFRKKSLRSVSYSRDFLPRVYNFYMAFREDPSIYDCLPYAIVDAPAAPWKFHAEAYLRPTLLCNDGYITYLYNPNSDAFEGYKFDRSTRSYRLVDYTSRIAFCDYVLSQVGLRVGDIQYERDVRSLINQFQEELIRFPRREEIVDAFISRRAERSKLYELQHNQFSKL